MIEQLKKSIFSLTTAGFALLLLAVILGFATFVESSYGADAARALVYGSWWFELLLLFFTEFKIDNYGFPIFKDNPVGTAHSA